MVISESSSQIPYSLLSRCEMLSSATTAPSGPFAMHAIIPTTIASKPPPSSNGGCPVSPDQVSAPTQHHIHHQHPSQPSGKPPISPPSVQQGLSRMNLGANGSTTSLPTLTRLPSLTARRSLQHSHHEQRPSMMPISQPHHHPTITTTATTTTTAAPAPPVAPQNAETASPRELAARLALLLHARECCTPFDMERVCGVRNCRVARGVLDHCQECFLPENQCHRSCCEAKQLLRHFRVCRAQSFQRACAICDVLRSEFAWAMQHARSLTPLFVPRDQELQLQQQQPQQLHFAPQRRHSYQSQSDGLTNGAAPTSLRRSVSDGPHATMSAMGHHKRSAPPVYHQSTERKLSQPTTKRVRIVTPAEEEAAAAAAAAAATTAA